MNDFMMILVAIALAVTFAVLFAGLFTMARGGDFNRKYGNKLMRVRVIAQGVALLLFAIAIIAGNG
jgi:nitrogen fixation-related uncharacterized protein